MAQIISPRTEDEPTVSDFDFRQWLHRASDWAADYHETLRDRPVRARTVPGAVAAEIAAAPPESGEAMESDLCRFRTHHSRRHDPLAASALLCLFPVQRRARRHRRRTAGRRHGGPVHAVADLAGGDRARSQDGRLAAPGRRSAGCLQGRAAGHRLLCHPVRHPHHARACS